MSYSIKSAKELCSILYIINLAMLLTFVSIFLFFSVLEHVDMPEVNMK